MERREDSFYTAYSYGDKLEEGHKLTLEHHISFDQRHANLSALTWMPLDRLQALRSKSVEAEKTVFCDLQEAAKRWEEQAAQTMILDRAIEYVKTPEVQHSGNRWEDTDYGGAGSVIWSIRCPTASARTLPTIISRKSRCRWRGMCHGA